MKGVSIIASLFRIILLGGIALLLMMLYWSSLEMEKRSIEMSQELGTMKHALQNLQREVKNKSFSSSPTSLEKQERPQIDSSSENLLTQDPFYEKTLPKLLPKDFIPHGTRRQSIIGRPKDLHVFSGWVNEGVWWDMCVPALAEQHVGFYETLAPSLAIKIEQKRIGPKQIPEYWVHLREGVYWEALDPTLFGGSIDLAPHFLKRHLVTAHDFKFWWDAIMNPFVERSGAISSRNNYSDIEEIRVIDDLTFVVRWKAKPFEEDGKTVWKNKYVAKQLTGGMRPLPRFVFQHFADGSKIIENDSDSDAYRTNSVWGQSFNEHWAKNIIMSCGPWIFAGKTDREIRFERNTDFFKPLANLFQRSHMMFRENPDSIWQDFKSLQIDSYNLDSTQLLEWEDFQASEEYQRQVDKGLAIKRLDYLQRSYSYIGWNSKRTFFSNAKLRQAMTLAIDRERIVENIMNGLAIQVTGTFYVGSPSYNQSVEPWPYDPDLAKRYLEQEGWVDTTGNGIRDKLINGERVSFTFRLAYYVKNPTSEAIASYVAKALGGIGVDCTIYGLDLPDLTREFEEKSFDAVLLGWGLASPPEKPRQLWHSEWAEKQGSSNAVGFNNAEADKIIEELEYTYDQKERLKLYHRFHEILHEEQPYTFLFTPKTALLYREYLQNVFVPKDRQDLIPGADVVEPVSEIFWTNQKGR